MSELETRDNTCSNNVCVGDDNSLGRTGCSGRVHDTGQVVWFWRRRVTRIFFAGFKEVIVRNDSEVVMRFL